MPAHDDELIQVPEIDSLPSFDPDLGDDEPGDMPTAAEWTGPPRPHDGTPRSRVPVNGYVEFLRVPLPLPLYGVYASWELARPDDERKELEARSEGDKMATFLMDAVARDAEADDDRPPDQKQYDFTQFYGRTFRQMAALWQVRQRQAETAQQLEALRTMQRQRIAAKLPHLTADEIEDLLGPAGVDD